MIVAAHWDAPSGFALSLPPELSLGLLCPLLIASAGIIVPSVVCVAVDESLRDGDLS